MSIQWYPGHMTKARRIIANSMPSQDLVIEVLDARMPAASENPVVAEIRGQKPCVKVLNKSDLADPQVTKAWLRHLEELPIRPGCGKVLAVAVSSKEASATRRSIAELCKRLVPRGGVRPIRAMILGIPNVGKSTLINTLMNRSVAKTGDEPAVTKTQQLVVLKSGMVLTDNPGILWPKLEDHDGSFRLALGGAMPDGAIDYESIGLFGAEFFSRRYPELLLARYKLKELWEAAGTSTPAPPAIIEAIGRGRGALGPGGTVDRHKATDTLVHDFRTGRLGRISLEEPPSRLRPELEDGEQ